MKKAIFKDLLENEFGAHVGDEFQIASGLSQRLRFGDLNPVDVLGGDDFICGVIPEYFRNVNVVKAGEVFGENLNASAFVDKIQLSLGGLFQFAHHALRIKLVTFRHISVHQAC